jgi:lysophospholipase L1-like esterase
MKKLLCLLAIIVVCASFKREQVSWVAIGDSITYLNDHPDETGHRVSKGYLTRVTDQLPHVRYTNQGHNGWTAVSIAKEIDKLGLEKADIYSVFLGTNDWWAGLPLGRFQDYTDNTGNGTFPGAYPAIINKNRHLNPDAKSVLITPMQRVDFVYLRDMKNNAWGSYREKNGQSLAQFAAAVKTIAVHEQIKVIDLYNRKGMSMKSLVKFKRLKDPATGAYRNYPYPDFIDIPFDPSKDEYPYPPEAIDVTYDGLHPSDKGNQLIADMLVKIMKK